MSSQPQPPAPERVPLNCTREELLLLLQLVINDKKFTQPLLKEMVVELIELDDRELLCCILAKRIKLLLSVMQEQNAAATIAAVSAVDKE